MVMKKITIYLLILLVYACHPLYAVTRFWVGGSGNFNDGNHWSLSSGGSPIGGTINWLNTDIAKFDANSGSPTVMFTGSEYIDKLHISGSITVTFIPNSTSSRTLTVGHAAAEDNFTLASASTLVIKGLNAATDRNMTVSINNIDNIKAYISGYIKVTDDDTGYGKFVRGSGSTVTFNAGSTYEHNSAESASNIPVSTWNVNSTCLITGITGDQPGNLDQSFGNFTWNCPNQNTNLNLSGIPHVTGNFELNSTGSAIIALSVSVDLNMTIEGNYTQTGGNFYPSNGTADNTLFIGGNFSMSGGYLGSQSNGSTQLVFNKPGIQNYSQSGGTVYYYIHYTIMSGSTLNLGSSILGNALYCTGNFTLQSGAGLKTQYSTGIRSENNQGCIQLGGTKSFNSGASYTFYAVGNQYSGNAMPSTVGNLTIGSTSAHTHLTLNNPSASVTIPNGGKLTITADASEYSTISATGGITYNTGSSLEYNGLSTQPTTNVEFPAHPNGPSNLIINNSVSVVLNGNKTVKNDLSLTSGQLLLNGYTLTLQRLINKTGGGLTGGTTSSITIEGAANNVSLPGVTNGLTNLTINRASATITLTGNINIIGTMTMTAGSFTLSTGVLSYGASATLKYNGSSSQNCNSAEFPTTSGPYTLEIQSGATVTLHASRTLNGPLNLYLGIFSIGNNTLTLNNIINKTNGSLRGGSLSNISFQGGTNNSNLPGVTDGLQNLTINRSATITLTGNVNIIGTMSMTNGIFVLGGGVLSYGGSGILKYNGSVSQSTTSSEFPSSNGPYGLEIMNGAGVSLHNSRSLNGPLTLTAGEFNLGANTLTLGNIITTVFGGMRGGSLSNLVLAGGAFSTDLPGISDGLQTLTINRPASISLTGALNISGTMTITSGTFALSGGVLSYGTSGTLKYNGSSTQTTSSAEFPVINGPNILEIQSGASVNLHDSRSLNGNLNLYSGVLNIGDATLTLNNVINLIFGTLTGGISSTLVFNEYPSSTVLPNSSLGNLTINRTAGIEMGGNVTVGGNLSLEEGIFSIGSNTLALGGEILYNNGSLLGGFVSKLNFVGTGTTTHIRNLELQNMTLMGNFRQVIMEDDVHIIGALNLDLGTLSIGANNLWLSGSITQNLGSLTGGVASDMVIDGDQPPTILPAVELNDLTIQRSSWITMSGNVTIYGDLVLNEGQLNVGSNTLKLNGPEISGLSGNLLTDPTSSIVFGGVQSDVDIPVSIIELKNLNIENPNGVILNSVINIYGNAVVKGFLKTGSYSLQGGGNFNLEPTGKLFSGHVDGITGCIQVAGSTTFSSEAAYGFNGSENQLANFPVFTNPDMVDRLFVSNTNSSTVQLNSNLTVTVVLNLSSGSHLYIPPGICLTAAGTSFISGEDCLVIGADASGAGSFIDNEVYYPGGSVKAERYISKSRWHYVSSPVSNAVSAVFLDLYLKWFNETDSTWNYIVPVDVPLPPGQGYACWSQPITGDRTVSYSGILNTGTVEPALSATDRNGGGIGEWEGWNLLGNPYPSAIDWDLVPPENMINIDPTVYVWNGSQYLCYPYESGIGHLTDGIIPAQQAFFIKANDLNPQLILPQNSRVHGFSPYKNIDPPENLLVIKVEGNNYARSNAFRRILEL
jgi:hypothetical protein